MNRANLISLGVFFLVSIGMTPNSHAKSFQCNLKLDTFHLPSIAGCQMSLVNGKLVESYTSFFGNNQSLELDICPTDTLPPVKAKIVAKKLGKRTIFLKSDLDTFLSGLNDYKAQTGGQNG